MRIFLILSLSFLPFPSVAQPGTLDYSFGTGGITRVDFDGPTNSSFPGDVMVMPDKSILLLGSFGDEQFFTKLTADGNIDYNFGNSGFKVTNIGNVSRGTGMIMQPDGKIITGASRSNFSTYNDFVVIRYDWQGKLDPTFGNGGIAQVDVTGGQDYCRAIALQADRKILLAGESSSGLGLVRFNADGSMDHSFGNGGKVVMPFQGYGVEPCKLSILQDGKIMVVASWNTGSITGDDIVLIRFMADGSLDGSFGNGGISLAALPGVQTARAAVILPDKSIITTGIGNTNRCIVAKFTPSGQLDTRFGVDGVSTVNVVDDDLTNAIYWQMDGKIVVGGRARDTGSRFFLIRFNADGSLDRGFGTNGITQTLIEDGCSLTTLAMQNDGRILAVGTSFRRNADPNGSNEITVARYHGDMSASVKEAEHATINCYPNPANTMFNVSGVDKEFDYLVTRITGQVMMHGKGDSHNSSINISSLPPGNYLFSIIRHSNVTFVQQFVKN